MSVAVRGLCSPGWHLTQGGRRPPARTRLRHPRSHTVPFWQTTGLRMLTVRLAGSFRFSCAWPAVVPSAGLPNNLSCCTEIAPPDAARDGQSGASRSQGRCSNIICRSRESRSTTVRRSMCSAAGSTLATALSFVNPLSVAVTGAHLRLRGRSCRRRGAFRDPSAD